MTEHGTPDLESTTPNHGQVPFNHRGTQALLDNVDAILAQSCHAENDHQHQASGYDVSVAQVRATQAMARAMFDLGFEINELRSDLRRAGVI